MTGKKQQIEQEELRAATAIMLRAIILAAIVALVVSAAPVASAGTPNAKPPRFERAERATAFVWLAELSPVVTIGAGKDRGWWAYNQRFHDGSKVKVIPRDGQFLG